MKKTIISLLALTACISANAQTMKIYKGTTLVAEYPADQADNIIFSQENSEQPTTKKYILEKYIEEDKDGAISTSYFTTDDQGSTIAVINKATYGSLRVYAYRDNQIQSTSYDHTIVLYTLNDKNLIVKAETYNSKEELAHTDIYEYDSKGRIISEKDGDGNLTATYIWNDDDDLIRCEMPGSTPDIMTITDITPSELSVNHSHTINHITGIDEALFMNDYFGMASKHLPAHKETATQGTPLGLSITNDYTYTITNGRLMGMETHTITDTQPYGFKSENNSKFTFVWKEIK